MWFLYIAKFADNKLYTGISTDVKRRIAQHNKGIGAKSLKGKGPVTLLYSEVCESRTAALKREHEIKGWSRLKKLKLIHTKV